jgi:hypothetical protein
MSDVHLCPQAIMRLQRAALAFATLLLLNCGGRARQPATPRAPVPLSQLSRFDNEIYPLANGDAYLVNGINDQLFLLSQGFAVRVTGVELRGPAPTIYPLPNGAAYLASADAVNFRLYYLVGTTVTKVKESTDISFLPKHQASYEGFLWAQAQTASSKIRRQQRLAREEEESSEQPDDYYR